MVDQVIQFTKYYFLCIIVLETLNHVASQQYNLTRSPNFAVLGEAFTWTCEMILPSGESSRAVFFYRNNVVVGGIGYIGNNCTLSDTNPRYNYACLSESRYTLTISAENMTEFEQNSIWRCAHATDISYDSDDVVLTIAIEVHNITLTPSNNPLKIIEGTAKQVTCVVNKNAVPAPNITWFLGSIDITSRAGANTTTIIITVDRTDNSKMLQCKATNNIKQPRMANTTLLVEYPPIVEIFSPLDILEGKNLSVTSQITLGNPNDTTIIWTYLDEPEFKQNGATLHLPKIQRTSSGTYICTAENDYSNGEKGISRQSMVVNVLYPPTVETLSQQDILEGENLSVTSQVTLGNPNDTTIFWTKLDEPEFKQNGATIHLPRIQRTRSGTYICTAENDFSNGEKGISRQSVVVNVLYPPVVKNLSHVQDIVEGRNVSVVCQVIPGNPNLTFVYWSMDGNPGFQQNGTILQLFFIQKTSSGTYYCNAENNYNNKETGKHKQSTIINVLYQPTIENKPVRIVNESAKVALTRNIYSNPWSDVSWRNGTDVLKTETSVKTTTFTIERAMCTDTRNFTLVASNGVQNNATTLVELRVNCEPKPENTNITLGVTDITGIIFSTNIIAYPEPWYDLQYENGSKNHQMMDSVTRNAVNNFTIRYNQTDVNQEDYGTYHLQVNNTFGKTTIFVNILPQRSPDIPRNIEVTCDKFGARVQWKSSFNGGDPQSFTIVINGQGEKNIYDGIPDAGENEIHTSYVQNLQPSTAYVFYISAQNQHGNSSSTKSSCKTLDQSENVPLIAGGAAAGGITLAIIVIVVVVLLRRYMQFGKRPGKNERLNHNDENEDMDGDGLKDNILYVSAGPKLDEQPEASVYAAVNKKKPEGNNNANADAGKIKSGQKQTEEGALYSDIKPKKGKKKKSKQKQKNVADVYENSENIAMASKIDNVYSNTARKDQTKSDRGYKNKDGLLYVEVKFEAKSDKVSPVIHGEDEKTDYATVDFPMRTTPIEGTSDGKI